MEQRMSSHMKIHTNQSGFLHFSLYKSISSFFSHPAYTFRSLIFRAAAVVIYTFHTIPKNTTKGESVKFCPANIGKVQ